MKPRQLTQIDQDLQACADDAGIKIDLCQEPTYLGQGTFARVYSVLLQGRQESVAVKLIDTDKMKEEHRKTEIRMMAGLTERGASAHGIMPYFGNGYNQSRSLHAIFMPCVVNGKLTDWLKDKIIMNSSRQVQITYGIACGLSFLNQHKVVHRDIKSDNILLNERLQPIIADFGAARLLPEGGFLRRTDLDKPVGTPIYMAPEILVKYIEPVPFFYSSASDVYAAALVIWQIFSRELSPFNAFQSTYDVAEAVVHQNVSEKIPDQTKCPEPIANLITWGWAHRWQARPTPMQMEAHLLLHYGKKPN